MKSWQSFARKIPVIGKRFPTKIRDIHEIEKIIASALAFLILKSKEMDQIYVSRNTYKNMLIYYW